MKTSARAFVALTGLALVAAFVWLFGTGTVFGQEAGVWSTARSIVQTRVLGEDVVKLSNEPEKYVVTADGRPEYLDALRRRGLTLVDQGGSAMSFRTDRGRRCVGYVYAFTSALQVYYAPEC